MTDDALCFLPAHQLAERIRTRATSPVEIVEAHLRADRNLTPETANALSELFRVAYTQFSRSSQAKPTRKRR